MLGDSPTLTATIQDLRDGITVKSLPQSNEESNLSIGYNILKCKLCEQSPYILFLR